MNAREDEFKEGHVYTLYGYMDPLHPDSPILKRFKRLSEKDEFKRTYQLRDIRCWVLWRYEDIIWELQKGIERGRDDMYEG